MWVQIDDGFILINFFQTAIEVQEVLEFCKTLIFQIGFLWSLEDFEIVILMNVDDAGRNHSGVKLMMALS